MRFGSDDPEFTDYNDSFIRIIEEDVTPKILQQFCRMRALVNHFVESAHSARECRMRAINNNKEYIFDTNSAIIFWQMRAFVNL